MQVETFECMETATEPLEASEEAVRLIGELGLKGQLELVAPKQEGVTQQARCPYREITREEAWVYQVLCPVAVKVEDYDAGPIPLRVLQVASHAKSLGMFKRLLVWDRESVTVKDPVLVGCTGDTYDWQSKTFILARWGDELEPFAVLLKRAQAIFRERAVEAIESIQASISSHKAAAQAMPLRDMIDKGASWVPKLDV